MAIVVIVMICYDIPIFHQTMLQSLFSAMRPCKNLRQMPMMDWHDEGIGVPHAELCCMRQDSLTIIDIINIPIDGYL